MGNTLTVQTALLDVEVRRHGNPENTDKLPVVLLHGWPDSVATWTHVIPALASAGHQVYAPSVRGTGQTKFRYADTPRTGRLGDLLRDLFAVCDQLKLERFHLVGHDWGARTAFACGIVAPHRIASLSAISAGWHPAGHGPALSSLQAQRFWYQWLLNTPAGADLLRRERRELVELIWRDWSPNWKFSDQEFDDTFTSLQSSDWLEVTPSYYRARWGWGPVIDDPFEKQIAQATAISVPSLVLHGDSDNCVLPIASEGMNQHFPHGFSRLTTPGVGHFPQREDPLWVSGALLQWFKEWGNAR